MRIKEKHNFTVYVTAEVFNVTADDVYATAISGLTTAAPELHLNYCRLPFSAIYCCRYDTITGLFFRY